MPAFKNEPLTDFSIPANRQAMDNALASVRQQLGGTFPLVLNGKRIQARSTFTSINPSRPKEIVGRLQNADKKAADRALETAVEYFGPWCRTPVRERATFL